MFTVLNLFIALIVISMQTLNAETSEEIHQDAQLAHNEREALSRRIDDLKTEIQKLHRRLAD